MLGIFLIYWIGKTFYELAEKYQKNKWVFAILGVVSYYTGTFVAGVVAFIVADLAGISLEGTNDFILQLVGVLFGAVFCIIYYQVLIRIWRNTRMARSENIIDDDFIDGNFIDKI